MTREFVALKMKHRKKCTTCKCAKRQKIPKKNMKLTHNSYVFLYYIMMDMLAWSFVFPYELHVLNIITKHKKNNQICVEFNTQQKWIDIAFFVFYLSTNNNFKLFWCDFFTIFLSILSFHRREVTQALSLQF